MNEWTNELMNEWMNERMHEWKYIYIMIYDVYNQIYKWI